MRLATLALATALSTAAGAPLAVAQMIAPEPPAAPVPGTPPTPGINPANSPTELRPGETPSAALHANDPHAAALPAVVPRGGGPRHHNGDHRDRTRRRH